MPDPRTEAVDLLVNYFQQIAEAAGMDWAPDYTAEVREAVDQIVAAAVDQVRAGPGGLDAQLRALGRRVEELERLARRR